MMSRRLAWSLLCCLISVCLLAPAHAETRCTVIDAALPGQPVVRVPIDTGAGITPARLTHPGIKTHRLYGRHCVTLVNEGALPVELLAHVLNPRIKHIAMHRESPDGGMDQAAGVHVAGIDYPLTQWKTFGSELILPLVALPQQRTTYVFETASAITYNSALAIQHSDTLLHGLAQQQIAAGLLIGMIAGIALYFLFLGLSHREPTYLYLTGSTLSVALLQMGDLGKLYGLWPSAIHWNQASTAFLAVLSTLFGSCLARKFLLLRDHMPRTDRALNAYAWYNLLVCVPLSLVGHEIAVLVVYAFPAVLFLVSLLLIAGLRMRHGYRPARLYLVAYSMPFFSGLLIVADYLGLLATSPYIRLLPLVGTAVQLVLFSLALGTRIRWLELQRQALKLEEIRIDTEHRTRQHFMAQISHDIRTPILGILGLAELIDRTRYNAHQRKLADSIRDSARRLLDVTNKILDYARLDAGKWEFQQAPFALRNSIEHCAYTVSSLAGRPGVSVRCHLHDNVPAQVVGDEASLMKILSSLVENALKFTRNGSVSVMAETVKQQQDTVFIRFDVIDTGAGFDEGFKDEIFNVFSVEDPSPTREHRGAGISLSICRKLCVSLGGEIGCDSKRGAGSIFWFILPFRRTTAELPPAPTPTTADTLPTGGHLLIAEDDLAMQLIISEKCRAAGLSFALFPHGKALLDHLATSTDPVDLVILDWNMPVMNAAETLDRLLPLLHERPRPPAVAIMSAHLEPGSLDPYPGVHTLRKPPDVAEIRKLLIIPDTP